MTKLNKYESHLVKETKRIQGQGGKVSVKDRGCEGSFEVVEWEVQKCDGRGKRIIDKVDW